MKNLIIAVILLHTGITGWCQKYYTKTAQVSFDATSDRSPERIEGVNRSGVCIVDVKTGNLQFAVLMKGFSFERALMEEHFNENYVESDKYPKAEFKGEIKNNSDINYLKDGTYPVKVKGKFTMHGESKEIETDARISIVNGKIKAMADFNLVLSDYKVSIPGLVADKVSKIARISVSCSFDNLFSNTNSN